MKKPWQEMKTAPRDGSWVLLAEQGNLTGHDGIRYVASYWKEDKREIDGGLWVDTEMLKVKALGWLPIPEFK